MPVPERRERIALNESRFREINDRLKSDMAQFTLGDEEHIDFVCECGNFDCRSHIAMTQGEYEAVRAASELFAVVPGHEIPAAEDVVSTNDRFTTVRKHEDVHGIVEATDPRRDEPSD